MRPLITTALGEGEGTTFPQMRKSDLMMRKHDLRALLEQFTDNQKSFPKRFRTLFRLTVNTEKVLRVGDSDIISGRINLRD